MGLVKWWKSKFAWTIIGITLLVMILGLISVLFIPEPFNIITVILLCVPYGLVMRKLISKKILELTEK